MPILPSMTITKLSDLFLGHLETYWTFRDDECLKTLASGSFAHLSLCFFCVPSCWIHRAGLDDLEAHARPRSMQWHPRTPSFVAAFEVGRTLVPADGKVPNRSIFTSVAGVGRLTPTHGTRSAEPSA